MKPSSLSLSLSQFQPPLPPSLLLSPSLSCSNPVLLSSPRTLKHLQIIAYPPPPLPFPTSASGFPSPGQNIWCDENTLWRWGACGRGLSHASCFLRNRWLACLCPSPCNIGPIQQRHSSVCIYASVGLVGWGQGGCGGGGWGWGRIGDVGDVRAEREGPCALWVPGSHETLLLEASRSLLGLRGWNCLWPKMQRSHTLARPVLVWYKFCMVFVSNRSVNIPYIVMLELTITHIVGEPLRMHRSPGT